jgi:hypothetical protein
MRPFIFAIALVTLSGCALGDDVVTMPTANMLKRGEMEFAYYHVDLNTPSHQPQTIEVPCYYVGVTDWLELDAQVMAVDKDVTSCVLIGNLRLLHESPTTPDLVFGCRNMAAVPTTSNPPFSPINYRARSANQSYYLCAAKTFFFNHDASGPPKPPLVRLHACLGTADWTLGLEERHDGLFGGLQALVTPYLGFCVLNDGRDLITGIAVSPGPPGLIVRAGGFGDRWYVGVAYRWGGMW